MYSLIKFPCDFVPRVEFLNAHSPPRFKGITNFSNSTVNFSNLGCVVGFCVHVFDLLIGEGGGSRGSSSSGDVV